MEPALLEPTTNIEPVSYALAVFCSHMALLHARQSAFMAQSLTTHVRVVATSPATQFSGRTP